MKHRILSLVCAVVSLWLASGNVHAVVGSVKVECFGRCDLIKLSEVCATYDYYQGRPVGSSQPIAIACDDTAVGVGLDYACGTDGNGRCRPYGNLVGSDHVSAYCNDGPSYDAVVTCHFGSTTLGVTADGLEDEEQKLTDGEEDTAVVR